MITYEFLQNYWWFIISLLGGILVFMLFVQGGQSMLGSLSKTENEKNLVLNALGRRWGLTFTTLVVFGGAFFASFPLFYATSFGGAYWVWMLILFSFVVQAVSFEFQGMPNNFLGQKTYRGFLFFNGVVGTFVLGVAVATFFTGSEFTINKANLVSIMGEGNTMSGWDNPLHGLEALGNFRNWALGLAVLFLARTQACLFLINRVHYPSLTDRARKFTLYNGIPFLVFFLTFLIWTLVSEGYAVNPETKEVTMEAYKYLHNFIEMPLVLILFIIGVVLVLWGIFATVFNKSYNKGIWFSGAGTILTVTMLFLVVGYNNTSFYPSYTNLASSLTVQNASSSEITLKAMAVVSLFVPFVIAYIFYAWRALEKKQLTLEDTEGEGAY